MINTAQEFAEIFNCCKNSTGDIFIIVTAKEPFGIYAAYGFNGRRINKVVGQDNWDCPRTAKKYIPSFYITPRGNDTIHKCGLFHGGIFNSRIYQIASSDVLREGLKLLGARGKWLNDIRYNFKHTITYEGYGFMHPKAVYRVSFGLGTCDLSEGLDNVVIHKELEINKIDTSGGVRIEGTLRYYYALPGETQELQRGALKIYPYMDDFRVRITYDKKEAKSANTDQFPLVRSIRRPIEGDEDHSSWEYHIDPEFPNGIIKVRQSIKYEHYQKWLDYDIGGYAQAINSSNDSEGEWVTASRYLYEDNWQEVDPNEFFAPTESNKLNEVLEVYKYKSRREYCDAQIDIRRRNEKNYEDAKQYAIDNIEEYYKSKGYRKVIVNIG